MPVAYIETMLGTAERNNQYDLCGGVFYSW